MGRLSIIACVSVLFAGLPAFAADLCALTDIHGAYGFQFEGVTKIGGPEKPLAGVARLVFDGTKEVSGVSSVNFDGLFLGNPVTGSYEFHSDCSLDVHLQDTSGAFQNLSGRAASGGNRVELRQSDSGTAVHGLMVRLASVCTASGLSGRFNLTLTGHATPFVTEASKGSGPAKATLDVDGAGNLVIYRGNTKTSGNYQIDSDCIFEAQLGIADANTASSVKLRGVLVNEGKEVLAVETDPEQVASARLSQ